MLEMSRECGLVGNWKLYKHNEGVNPNFILDGASGNDDITEYFDFATNPRL
jgi:hypothetical protein